MQVIARRAVLAGAGTLVAASVASALLLRKPAPPVVLTPVDAPPRLRDIAALKRLSPPQAMPAITFRDATGTARTLADFSGRGVVLNIWATWCAPCVAEMPALAVLAGKVTGDGIAVLPLSIDRGGAAAVRTFYAAHHIAGLGVWTDANGDADRALGVDGVPTTFIVDRQGRRAAVLQGAADWGSDAAAGAVRALV